MEIDVLTLFPAMFEALDHSIFKRAKERGLVVFRAWDIRDFATDRHRTVDDTPYGGGAGMVIKPEPVHRALLAAAQSSSRPADRVILMSPQGRRFSQEIAWELAREQRLILICGHYEGVDERVRTKLATDEISIGDYVLTGGELAAMVVIDAVVRLVPGVLGSDESAKFDSFGDGLLEHPHYTRPREYLGESVPEVLLSGDHQAIARWRRKESLRRTKVRRPDLLASARLTAEDLRLLREIEAEEEDQAQRDEARGIDA